MSVRTAGKVDVCLKPIAFAPVKGELELKTRRVRMVAECLWSWAMMESEVRKEGLALDIKTDEEFSET